MKASRRLLVVEDNSQISAALGIRLRFHGYDVRVAAGLCEARDFMRGCPPDAIVLDINLPDGSGLDLPAIMEADNPHLTVPVIMMSASKRAGLKQAAHEAGAHLFLEKPFDSAVLISTLDGLFDQKSARVSGQIRA